MEQVRVEELSMWTELGSERIKLIKKVRLLRTIRENRSSQVMPVVS